MFGRCAATAFEKRRPFRADLLVPNALMTVTHAVTIDAPPERVWPWIAQMGSGRAGWYAWDVIDNGGMPSARSIRADLQTVAAGDIMPAIPGATDAFVVALADPPRDLMLTVPDDRGGVAVAWEHVLEPLAINRTRLVVRGRVSSHWLDRARDKPVGRRRILIERGYAMLARLPKPLLVALATLGHGVMEKRHLRGIERRSRLTAA